MLFDATAIHGKRARLDRAATSPQNTTRFGVLGEPVANLCNASSDTRRFIHISRIGPFRYSDELLAGDERWLGLSEQARRLDKWIVCRVLCRCEKRLIEVGVVR
ncbi:hypothetical protein, partial [Aurantimonas sp. A3-2-R12]|uniref:hypothetical protein n=1 Tax=Aurantimonas sp. A3-2-R12 TaxID=3114362 RepID=UPI002E17E2BF|nr:hypothetical protein [Aurantimonas sp. A3-2-R12]